MSTKGQQLSAETKHKISIAKTEHLLEEFTHAWDRYELKLREDPKKLPTIVGYCLEVGIPQQNILQYCAKYTEVSDIVNTIVDLQEVFCLENGIRQTVNPIFSMFLLKSKHKYQDSPQQLTQNNYMNISPDVLADALRLSAQNDKPAK